VVGQGVAEAISASTVWRWLARELSVVDLAEHGVIGFADGLGVRRPRPLVADGALVGSVTGCSAF
jgi:hypothetical protein